MFRRLGVIFAAVSLFSIAGGHWAVLQTVAWAGMLADYSHRTGSLTAAIEQTFDGAHPCALCKQIRVAKGQERSVAAQFTGKDAPVKAVLASSAATGMILAAGEARAFADHPSMVAAPGGEPPVPPPRA